MYMENVIFEKKQKMRIILNNVKIGQGQLQLIMKQILFYHIWGFSHFSQVT